MHAKVKVVVLIMAHTHLDRNKNNLGFVELAYARKKCCCFTYAHVFIEIYVLP